MQRSSEQGGQPRRGGAGRSETQAQQSVCRSFGLTSGLDHDEISTLLQIALDRLHGQTATEGRQLIAGSVAKLCAGSSRIAEGSVEHRCEFRCVRHDRHASVKSCALESEFDCSNSSVHHIGGRDDVSAALRQEHGHLGDAVNARLVVDRVILLHDAAVTRVGVCAQTHVDHEQQVRVALGEVAQCERDGRRLRRGEAARGVLRRQSRNAEQQHRAKAESNQRRDQLVQAVDSPAILLRQRFDLGLLVRQIVHEDRVDEFAGDDRRGVGCGPCAQQRVRICCVHAVRGRNVERHGEWKKGVEDGG